MTVAMEAGARLSGLTAVDKALTLLDAFGDCGPLGAGVSDLARRTGLTKSTAFRMLGMLHRAGLVERVGTRYLLGHRMHELGCKVYPDLHDNTADLLCPFVVDLYQATNQEVSLNVLHQTDIVVVHKLSAGRISGRTVRIGDRVPAHATSAGKVMLAFDPAATRLTLEHGLQRLTGETVTDQHQLLQQLARARQTGVMVAKDELIPGIIGIAAPIFGSNGRPIASLTVFGSEATFNPRSYEVVLRTSAEAASRHWQRSHRLAAGQ